MDTKSKVELRPAVVWTCPSCCHDNYETCYEATQDDVRDLCAEQGISMADVGELGQLSCAPSRVICRSCNVSFDVEDEQSGDEKGQWVA